MKTFIIYRITFPTKQVYIGQTTKHHFTRWGTHIDKCSEGKHVNPTIQAIYNEYGSDNWEFEILIKDTYEDKSYVNLLEGQIIRIHGNNVNRYENHVESYYQRNKEELRKYFREKYIPKRSRQEQRTKLKEMGRKQYMKEWYEENKEELLEKHRQYRNKKKKSREDLLT